MRAVQPTAAFNRVELKLVNSTAVNTYARLYSSRHPDALGIGKTPSRFSDPRRRVDANRFGVLYLGKSLKVCFVEAFLRDRRDGQVGDYPVSVAQLNKLSCAQIRPTRPLRLLDLRGDGPVRMGIPSDVIGASNQTLARAWSVAFYEHPSAPDGVLYPSRLNEELNVAVYDRAISKLKVMRNTDLLKVPELADVLEALQVALI